MMKLAKKLSITAINQVGYRAKSVNISNNRSSSNDGYVFKLTTHL